MSSVLGSGPGPPPPPPPPPPGPGSAPPPPPPQALSRPVLSRPVQSSRASSRARSGRRRGAGCGCAGIGSRADVATCKDGMPVLPGGRGKRLLVSQGLPPRRKPGPSLAGCDPAVRGAPPAQSVKSDRGRRLACDSGARPKGIAGLREDRTPSRAPVAGIPCGAAAWAAVQSVRERARRRLATQPAPRWAVAARDSPGGEALLLGCVRRGRPPPVCQLPPAAPAAGWITCCASAGVQTIPSVTLFSCVSGKTVPRPLAPRWSPRISR